MEKNNLTIDFGNENLDISYKVYQSNIIKSNKFFFPLSVPKRHRLAKILI